MPGILPMKVIKVGSNAQTRIAQACDRCRSKKIRCDGVRPCCSQCSSVGFECKTSDKLSRRAFPRGYTESLEERVRTLESEVRELKDLLDEKDEKIDLLSRLHSQSSIPTFHHSPQRPSASPVAVSPATPAKEETFRVQQAPQLEGQGAASYFTGTSSSKTFLDSFKQKIQESGQSASDIHAEKLFTGSIHIRARDPLADPITWRAPPRLESDKMIGVFFQEWAPLFPVLHRPSFLELYQRYMQAPETIVDNCSHAQLNLVFGIAALSTGSRDSADLISIETQWQAAIDTILTDHSMPTLQCLVLAQLYCIQRGDHDRLLTYKALAVSLSSKLGLHQSQKRFALGTSTCEIRKKVFWTLYTVDCFSAVTLGLPKLLKDEDVHCEYPVDADEEYIEETGFKAPCPGEFTRISSALALFRAARILSRVLQEVYPALPSYDLSLLKLAALSADLDNWNQSLAPHLRLPFAQDKPSTGTTSSRSPLLSLTYHYIQSLIHRPAVIAGLGTRASSSTLALAQSCKHTIQIVELLVERGLGFSFCLNKDELIILAGLGLLYQSLGLDGDSKLYKDTKRMVTAASGILEQTNSPCAPEFKRITWMLLPINSTAPKNKLPPMSRHNSDGDLPAPNFMNLSSPQKNKLQKAAQRLGIPLDHRRATMPSISMPNISMHQHALQTQSQPNLALNAVSEHVARSEPALSPEDFVNVAQPTMSSMPAPKRRLNLDYMSFSNVSTRAHSPDHTSMPSIKTEPTDWERLLGSIDGSHTNIFDNIYGGPAVELMGGASDSKRDIDPTGPQMADSTPSTDSLAWKSPADVQWTFSGADTLHPAAFNAQPESVFSMSTDDGSTNNNEELFSAVNDWGSVSSSNEVYGGIVMPDMGSGDEGLMASVWETTAVM